MNTFHKFHKMNIIMLWWLITKKIQGSQLLLYNINNNSPLDLKWDYFNDKRAQWNKRGVQKMGNINYLNTQKILNLLLSYCTISVEKIKCRSPLSLIILPQNLCLALLKVAVAPSQILSHSLLSPSFHFFPPACFFSARAVICRPSECDVLSATDEYASAFLVPRSNHPSQYLYQLV